MTVPKIERQPRLPMTTSLFALALGLGAALLFWIQPLVAKSLLPTTGGSPAIWHTVIVFFQTTLLLGYLYAHLLVSNISLRYQAVAHFALLAIALWFLPQNRFDLTIAVSTNNPERIPGQLWLGLVKIPAQRAGHWFGVYKTPGLSPQRGLSDSVVPTGSVIG